jgi:hypothetical protein
MGMFHLTHGLNHGSGETNICKSTFSTNNFSCS